MFWHVEIIIWDGGGRVIKRSKYLTERQSNRNRAKVTDGYVLLQQEVNAMGDAQRDMKVRLPVPSEAEIRIRDCSSGRMIQHEAVALKRREKREAAQFPARLQNYLSFARSIMNRVSYRQLAGQTR